MEFHTHYSTCLEEPRSGAGDGSDPEDGFNREVELQLASKSNAGRIDTWTKLWDVLFKERGDIPSSGTPESHRT